MSTPCVVEVIQWRLSNRVLCPLAALTSPLLHRQALWKEYTHVTFNATSQELPLHCLKTHSDTPNLTLPPSHMHEHTPISLLSFPHPCLHRPPVFSSSSLSAADSPWALIARLSFYSPASFFFFNYYFCSSSQTLESRETQRDLIFFFLALSHCCHPEYMKWAAGEALNHLWGVTYQHGKHQSCFLSGIWQPVAI